MENASMYAFMFLGGAMFMFVVIVFYALNSADKNSIKNLKKDQISKEK